MVGILVVILAGGYLLYGGMRSSSMYYLTVDEILQRRPELSGKGLRVGGWVVPESVQWDARTLKLRFQIADSSGRRLEVIHRGVVPDNFTSAQGVIVEGVLDPGGYLKAQTILTKCPSRYEPEKE